MTFCVNVLIAVRIPDWWERIAIDRYRAHAGTQTRIIGCALSEEQQAEADRGGLADVLVANALRAEEAAAMAHILDCFGDPVIEEVQARVRRPVLGVGQAGMHFGHAFSRSYAVITSEHEVIGTIRENAGRYGVDKKLAACRAVGVGAAEIPSRRAEVLDLLEHEAKKLPAAVDMIVLGCTELAEMAPELRQRMLKTRDEVRVINPLVVAAHWAEALAATQ